jgi:class 3 adenylate cyclase/tetratricopeptide (TPR) repeat protein
VTSREERKVVTVLFADLAGSTELSQRQDPEQLRQLLSAFFDEMSQQIRSFGGTVEKYAGDAIMAVFGVPKVHEDDAERAVRAAIAMRESLVQLNPLFEQEYDARLELRVGIATGEVVAATDERREMLVTGETANLAARLQSAGSGIVVSDATQKLLARLLDCRRLEPLTLKGFSQPVTAYEVSGLRTLDAAPRGIPGLSSPVVGRDAEAATLRRAVEELQRGRGQIVFLVGEAGIGKSRLKIELRDTLPGGVRWLEGRCQAYTQSTSYAPVVQLLRTALGLGPSEAQTVARARLRAGLRSLVGDRHDEVQPTIAHLLGIELEARRQADRPTDPQTLKAQLILALRALLEGLTTHGPAILTIEDIHWADAATIELLILLTELTDHLPLMILVTSRPDPEGTAWDLRFHAQRNFPHRLVEISLSTLRPEDTAQLVRNLLHVAELPEDLKGRIMERAEGNPFFLEEILRSLIDEGVLQREGDRWIAGRRLERLAMPDTLRGVIAARIDRLPQDVKATLQHAAVVGRFFAGRLLAALAEPGQDVDRAIAHLLRAELIREFARLPETEYIFKHALTHDAAYASILAEQRRRLHERVAEHLEGSVGGRSDEHAAVLADHWLRAERVEEALGWTLRAADRARGLYARPEAIAHYWQALELLARLPTTPDRQRLHAETVLGLVRTPGYLRDAASRETALHHIDEGIREAELLGAPSVQSGLESQKGFLVQDEDVMLRALSHAQASGDPLTLATAAWSYGEYLGQHGQYDKALTHIEQAIDLFGAHEARHDHAISMAMSGRCHCSRAGRLNDAFTYAGRAREIAAAMGDARLKAWGGMEAEPCMYKGLWNQLVRVGEEGLAVAWEIGEWAPIFFISAWLGIAYLKLGRADEARRVILRAVEEARVRTFSPFLVTYLHIALAQLHLAEDNLTEALTTARRALELADRSGFQLERGAARRVLAQVYGAIGSRAEAESEFRASLEILEDIQSRPELGQTLLAYGRFGVSDDAERGRRVIDRALRLFEEIDATGWIAEAKAALGER